MYALIIVLAILPSLLISYLIYRMDKHEPEDLLPLLICFALGMASTYPAMMMESLDNHFGLEANPTLFNTFLLAFFVVGFSEELVKFICLMLYPYFQKFFNEPMDGIVYAVMISMGFATLENILYANQFGIETIILRAFTAIPAHAAFAVVMGYYVGQAKFSPEKKGILLLQGLGYAILLHGVYDFFIIQNYHESLMVLATVILYASIYLGYHLIIRHQQNSPFKDGLVQAESAAEISVQKTPLDAAAPSHPNEIMDAVIAELEQSENPSEMEETIPETDASEEEADEEDQA